MHDEKTQTYCTKSMRNLEAEGLRRLSPPPYPSSHTHPARPARPPPLTFSLTGMGRRAGTAGVIPWRALGEVVTARRVCGAWTRLWRKRRSHSKQLSGGGQSVYLGSPRIPRDCQKEATRNGRFSVPPVPWVFSLFSAARPSVSRPPMSRPPVSRPYVLRTGLGGFPPRSGGFRTGQAIFTRAGPVSAPGQMNI